MSSPVSATPASTWAWLGLATLGFRVEPTSPLSFVTFDNDSEQDREVRSRFDDELRYRRQALMIHPEPAERRGGSQAEIDKDLSTRALRPAARAPPAAKSILKPRPQFGRESVKSLKLEGPHASVHFQRSDHASGPVAPGRIREREREVLRETAHSVTQAHTVKSLCMLT